MRDIFSKRLEALKEEYHKLVSRKNEKVEPGNGIFYRYKYPVLTAGHVPLEWRYDLDRTSNPYLLERLGINAVFNAGAIRLEDRIYLVCRVEGYDRKSFFAVAESENGIDFSFWDYPVIMPQNEKGDTNVYDMRLIKHEDGWIYGLFCTERKDPGAPAGDESSAVAQCGIARTKDLKSWERLPDLITKSSQQRNVVLHPEFIDGKYGLYTRPQDNFIDAGSGGGIGWGLTDSMENAVVTSEKVIDPKVYHSINEVKNGLGPAPLKTEKGWLHLAHGVRNTAAGLRYVVYLLLSDLHDPSKVIKKPSGYLIAPRQDERIGDVSNVIFSNGWVARDNGDIFLYYASSDTRMHAAATTVDILLDYVENTPADPLTSYECVNQRIELIKKNRGE